MISITVDRDQDWINKSTVCSFDEAWATVIFVPITKFTTVGEYDDRPTDSHFQSDPTYMYDHIIGRGGDGIILLGKYIAANTGQDEYVDSNDINYEA